MLLNDYFRLRTELNLAQFPDDMVRDTGREVERRIAYIVRDAPEFGLMPGFAVLGFALPRTGGAS